MYKRSDEAMKFGFGLCMFAIFLLCTPYWLLIWLLTIPGLAAWFIFWALVGRGTVNSMNEWFSDDY